MQGRSSYVSLMEWQIGLNGPIFSQWTNLVVGVYKRVLIVENKGNLFNFVIFPFALIFGQCIVLINSMQRGYETGQSGLGKVS